MGTVDGLAAGTGALDGLIGTGSFLRSGAVGGGAGALAGLIATGIGAVAPPGVDCGRPPLNGANLSLGIFAGP